MRLLILIISVFTILGCQTHQEDQVQLRWQVNESPALYSVVNQEIDVLPRLLVNGFDTLDEPELRRQVIQDLRGIELPVATYEGRVEPHEGGIRASLLAVSPETDRAPLSDQEELHRRMAEQKAGLTELLGDFSTDGKLTSYFLERRNQAALNLLFSLPSSPMATSDSWSPDVTGIEIGPRFFPQRSRRANEAILESLSRDEDGRLVATMFYVIADEVGGYFEYKQAGEIQTLEVDISNTYFAVGDFLVNEGRWKAFTAVNANLSGGDSGSQTMILYAMRLKD